MSNQSSGSSSGRTPIRIGVTGGIGAGKSSVLSVFAQRGAATFSADAAVHELYESPNIIRAVTERWGQSVLTAEGKVDRSQIAKLVFRDRNERVWLEQLLHPLVGKAWERFVADTSEQVDAPMFIVAEVPLLFEAGLEDRYDQIVVITAPTDLRIERAVKRGDHRDLSKQRAKAQLPENEKLARADYAFENTGSLDDLERFVDTIIAELAEAA